jgi:7-carboxy-7-deazaguanine synthase
VRCVQGEGPNTGRTTVFLRFGGCNLRCPGWPCDTQHAIDPAYREEWTKYSGSDLADEVDKVAELAGAPLVTFTGGEPFLQPRAETDWLGSELVRRGYQLEAFTNGTRPYSDWAVENCSMIMDWKLPGSGEDPHNEIRYANLRMLSATSIWHSVKFVCKNEEDFLTAFSLWSLLDESVQRSLHFFYGRVWDGEITNAKLAELVMRHQLPWRMNVQLHNYIWPANERGR